ncbi:MAG: FlgD immunoglobulin-like domain containing protein, partial [Candidatus Marinimicrobia bacterium]|nr:FlgD immunoglobulin-like domain containing protein [Candidatus Neomarinimicrobiota bacterium]
VDNIAPEVPTGLLIWETDESIELSWNESPDNDFYYFILEKSTDSVFVDYVFILTTNTAYTDTEYELNVLYYYRIAAVDLAGNVSGYSEIVSVVMLSLETDGLVPDEFTLHQNYPNPFNPITTLRYDLPKNSLVSITIYDIMGREVRTLVNQTQDAGFKSVLWNATNDYGKPVSAGVYLYQIQAGEF